MKLHILSDLHNEFLRNGKSSPAHHWNGVIPQTDADVIILAGDIDVGTRGVEWAIQESARLNKPVIYVPGNHEYYHHEYFSLNTDMTDLCKETDVHCLNRGVFINAGVRIIGATLWTDYAVNTQVSIDLAMESAISRMPDHRIIDFKSGYETRVFLPTDALSIHQKELSWIEQQLASPFDGKTVVITHHGPHPVCQHPGFPVNEITGAFHSDLSRIITAYDIDLWVYGHTHANLDVVVENTRIVANQAGYPGENVEYFSNNFIVTL